MELNIYTGLLVTVLVISVLKLIRFRFRDGEHDLSFYFWGANNWADYGIHLFITWVFIFFESDVLAAVNPTLLKLVSWEIPSPENKSFLYILIPIIVSLVFYKLLRKYVAKPVQKFTAPDIHKTFNS